MRRFWFVVKNSILAAAPATAGASLLAGGLGASIGGIVAAYSKGLIGISTGIAIGATIGVACAVAFIAAITIPLYALLFVIHFSKTNSIDVRPRRVILLNASPAKAMLACREAALQIPGASIDEAASSVDRVAAVTSGSWESFGENVFFDVRAVSGSDRCEAVVSSCPVIPTTVVDYGVNERNVETAIGYLRKSGLIDEAAGIALRPSRSDGSSI